VIPSKISPTALIKLIPRDVLGETLHHHGYPGQAPADRQTALLLDLNSASDETFLIGLELGFPEHVWAHRILLADPEGACAKLMINRILATRDQLRPETDQESPR